MKRYIYAFDSLEPARAAVARLREAGIDQRCISLVAKSDVQIHDIPDDMLDVSKDFVPAIERGAALGGASGLLAGLIAMAIPALGIAVGGGALLAFTAGGALVGAWTSSLAGAAVPDSVRRQFEDEIERGRVLLVLDTAAANDATAVALLGSGSDRHLIWQSAVNSQAA